MTNYIRHLNAFFSLVRSDKRLTSSHVSLYMALFHYWNFNRFNNPFPVYRQNLMQLSKIGSKTTYHKCIRELHGAQYIVYHPSPTRFQPVKISIIRLGGETNEGRFKQLDLFNGEAGRLRSGSSTVDGLDSVPPRAFMDTGTVPDAVHSLKQTGKTKNSVQHTPTIIFQKNRVLNSQMAALSREAKSVHVPSLGEVTDFFHKHNLGAEEAQRFFYYNQGKSWMLTDKLPVTDWKAIAKKWMLNPRSEWQPATKEEQVAQAVQNIYERFLQGVKVNKMILPEYADLLQIEITDTIKQEAYQRRINQLSGSNEASETRLWNAYMNEKWNDECVVNDQPNITALAKKLAVLKLFYTSKAKGVTQLIPPPGKNNNNEH